MLVVAGGAEGHLRQGVVVLRAGQRGVQHQHVGLKKQESASRRLVWEAAKPLKRQETAQTSPSWSRGGKWKNKDCPRDTLLMGLSRLSLLYSFT